MNYLKIQYKISKKFTKYKIYGIINMMNMAGGSSSRKKIIITIVKGGQKMNVFYKIVELSQKIADVKLNVNNDENFFVFLVAFIFGLLLVAFVFSASTQGFSPAFFMLQISFVAVFSFFYFIVKPNLEKENNNRIAKTKMENEKEIANLYNSNLRLFDSRKTDNVNEMIKDATEKKEKFDNEVNNITNEISNKLQDNKIYLEQEKIKPFAQLYVMDKEKIPVLGKVQQKVSPNDAGKICEAVKVKNCFNNSSFDEYNKEKKDREDELARMKKPDNLTDDLINAAAIGGIMYLILKD